MGQIKHIVILMQENRSFDEYFGTFPGATGFQDPTGVFTDQYGNGVLPFRMSTFTASGLETPQNQHSWPSFHTLYNGGQNGQNLWSLSGQNAVLAYYAANDIPFHWALASVFALCDHYFCSVLGPTISNRLFLMSGQTSDEPTACIGNPGFAGFNRPTWPSYADMLTQANVTWTIYDDTNLQQAEPDEPSETNGWGDLNVLPYFPTWSEYQNSTEHYVPTPATTIFPTPTQFEIDAAAGNLPTVSWIIPPFWATEWENNHPSDGAAYIEGKLDAIMTQASDGTFSWDSTVFILTYDEFGGHFDHVRLPPPPLGSNPQEYVSGQPAGWPSGPIGPGLRIPVIIASPWTVGRGVQSNNFDHTSILKFLALITGVPCANLVPAVGGT